MGGLPKPRCVICGQPTPERALLFCNPCKRSYDRARLQDSTIGGTITWAALRARRFARRYAAQEEYMRPADLDGFPGDTP